MDFRKSSPGLSPGIKLLPLKKNGFQKIQNMSKQKFRIRTNTEYGDRTKGEVNSGELLVVTDQAYTIEEILEKYTRGINLDINRDGQYSDTDDFNDVDERTYLNDLTDFEEIEASMAARRQRRSAKARKQVEPAPEPAEKPAEPDSKP